MTSRECEPKMVVVAFLLQPRQPAAVVAAGAVVTVSMILLQLKPLRGAWWYDERDVQCDSSVRSSFSCD